MPRIIKERSLALAEVRAILEEQEMNRELSSLENLTLDYVRKMAKISDAKRARELVRELVEKFDIPEEFAVQIVNIMPEEPGELRLILSPLNMIFSEEQLSEILNLLKRYAEE